MLHLPYCRLTAPPLLPLLATTMPAYHISTDHAVYGLKLLLSFMAYLLRAAAGYTSSGAHYHHQQRHHAPYVLPPPLLLRVSVGSAVSPALVCYLRSVSAFTCPFCCARLRILAHCFCLPCRAPGICLCARVNLNTSWFGCYLPAFAAFV